MTFFVIQINLNPDQNNNQRWRPSRRQVESVRKIGRAVQMALFLSVIIAAPVMAGDAETQSGLRERFRVFSQSFIVESALKIRAWALGEEPELGKKIPPFAIDLREVEEAAKYASHVTGVRKDFLMGMLVAETDLGRNMGKCTYQEVEEGAKAAYEKGVLGERAWKTFEKRRETIKALADDLGYDHAKLRVSCNPDQKLYVGTGGAMGIPQFMPDTWLEYKERLSAVTGKTSPDPWNVHDGVLAMALKLSDVPGVTSHNVWAEAKAAKMYLSGGTSWRYDWYARRVLFWARHYATLLVTEPA